MKLHTKELTNTIFMNSRVYHAIKMDGTTKLFNILDVNKLIIFKR